MIFPSWQHRKAVGWACAGGGEREGGGGGEERERGGWSGRQGAWLAMRSRVEGGSGGGGGGAAGPGGGGWGWGRGAPPPPPPPPPSMNRWGCSVRNQWCSLHLQQHPLSMRRPSKIHKVTCTRTRMRTHIPASALAHETPVCFFPFFFGFFVLCGGLWGGGGGGGGGGAGLQ